VVTAAALVLGLGLSLATAPVNSTLGEEVGELFAGPVVDPHYLIPGAQRALSKKEAWLTEKATRRDVHIGDRDLQRALATRRPRVVKQSLLALRLELPPVGTRTKPVTTLYNQRTREVLPLMAGEALEERFHVFLRDHFTNQATRMDVRLIEVLTQVAQKFRAARIEVVSGYRSPKYNLILRKKGREVARASQHTEGQAVDFRVRGVKTATLLRYVKSLRVGGVGFYPNSNFIHSDTGRIRYWKGS